MNEHIVSTSLLSTCVLVVDDYPSKAPTLACTISQLGSSIKVILATSGKATLETSSRIRERLTFTFLITTYNVLGLRKSTRRLKGGENADDFPDKIFPISQNLQNDGISFITPYNGIEVTEKIHSETPDLVLLDINMPEKYGYEILQKCRADPAIEHIPVTIITAARIGSATMQSGLKLCMDDYVRKPFDWRELLVHIRTRMQVGSRKQKMPSEIEIRS
jgi:CheY-like chemotaxis protein